jgi:DNA-binding transcriptional MerR regulator
MLTISQLASYAGVTVRAVRHYHAKGLLPEPERDHSGYRRYDAAAVVELIRIRTLAEAGVPLSRVAELLVAGPDEFAAAVEDIDRRLRAEIRERQRHRERIAKLAAGDSLALPPEAVAFVARLRELGISERIVEGERDAWILVAAQLPESMPIYMRLKSKELEHPSVVELYRDLDDVVDWGSDDPRLPALADRLVEQLEAADQEDWEAYAGDEITDDIADLLDAMFVQNVPIAPRLLELIEQRGWTGWTKLKRIDPLSKCNPEGAHSLTR